MIAFYELVNETIITIKYTLFAGYSFEKNVDVTHFTGKTHARGPVGLEGLVIYKYKLYGNGHVAGSYGKGKKDFIHQDIEL